MKGDHFGGEGAQRVGELPWDGDACGIGVDVGFGGFPGERVEEDEGVG